MPSSQFRLPCKPNKFSSNATWCIPVNVCDSFLQLQEDTRYSNIQETSTVCLHVHFRYLLSSYKPISIQMHVYFMDICVSILCFMNIFYLLVLYQEFYLKKSIKKQNLIHVDRKFKNSKFKKNTKNKSTNLGTLLCKQQ